MTISICGIGWLSRAGYGAIASGRNHNFAHGESLQTTPRNLFFERPVKNFGRFDDVSRLTLIAVSLALQDAAISAAPASKLDMGIIGTSRDGSLQTDLDYFRDYIDNGRTLSRANLFIYTLPSSPLGEAAIHFGLTGPLLYCSALQNPLARSLQLAAGEIASGGAGRMLAGEVARDEGLYFVLSSGGDEPLCSLAQALGVIESTEGFDEMVEKFLALKRGTL